MAFKLALLLFAGTLAIVHASFNYEGYKIYDTIPSNVEETDFLDLLSRATEDVDFFSLRRIPNTTARVMVAPKFQENFEEILTKKSFKFNVVTNDVSKFIRYGTVQPRFISSRPSNRLTMDKFYRHSEINNYLDQLSQKYSNYVTVESVGKSYEGRDIKTIRISNGVAKSNKKVIFVDAGIHAREWIAPAEALYIISELVENREANKDVLENLDWVVLPVVNPDGYEYTHTKQRLWRKTRSPNGQCVGTDGNRNFDFHWAEVGSSNSGCSDTYHGPKPFSDPETQIVRDILHGLKDKCKFYLTMHSFGNYLLYPWGWTSSLPATWRDLDEVSQAGAQAIRAATGSRYSVGSSTNVLYAAAGGSDDYALGAAGVPISITMELPSGGLTGFDPSPKQIKNMVTETWIGIKAMAKKVDEKYALAV